MKYRLTILTLFLLSVTGVSSTASASQQAGSLDSACDGTETFVFVPPGVDRHRYLSEYVKTHAGPSDAELKRCKLSREQWRAAVLKSN